MKVKTYDWLIELLLKEPKTFNEFFYSDIAEYLEIENKERFYEKLNNPISERLESFWNCKSKEEVKLWIDRIVAYIIKNIEVTDLIDNYFAK